MSALLTVTIPGNPGDGAINASRAIVNGRYIKSSRGRDFAARANFWVRKALTRDFAMPAECTVVLRCYWPRRRKLGGTTNLPMGDVDAPIKAVLDALEDANILDDDARVRRVSCEKYLDPKNPRIELEVHPVEVRPEHV